MRTAGVMLPITPATKARDPPVQQSTTIELIVNMKTAKALNVEILATIAMCADEVVE